MEDEPSEFTRRLHAGFGVSASTVVETARRATGEGVRACERIVRGHVNEVYRVRTDSKTFFVRIDRSGDADFAAEAWAMGEARRVHVPVPDVVLVDRVRDDEEDLPVMVLSALPGRPLADVEAELSPVRLRAVLTDAGRLLATLHSVRTPGVWKPEADGRWNTWDEIRDGVLAERRSERPELRSAGLSESEATVVLELVARCVDEYPWNDPVLCHGDFVPDHIFVDDDLRITGLLDFGMFHGGPPVSDLAYLRLVRPDLNQDGLLAGYGVSAEDREWLRQRDLHAVTHAVGYVAHSVRVGNAVQTAAYVRSLRSLVDDLRQRR
ncbi:phosphotransferase family protein [Actinopolymorpha singaporensis]